MENTMASMPHRSLHHGFTLMEMSIVITVIGIIVAGVIVAQDMMESARLQKNIAMTQELDTAMQTFKQKYGYMAGDMTNAHFIEYFPTVDINCSPGDEDGTLIGWNGAWTCGESQAALYQLNAAGMFATDYDAYSSAFGIYYNPKKLAHRDDAYIQPAYLGHFWGTRDNNTIVPPGNFIQHLRFGSLFQEAIYTAKQALAIDTKIDDGHPYSGSTIAQVSDSKYDLHPNNFPVNGGAWAVDCVANSEYLLTEPSGLDPDNGCNLAIRAGF